MTSLARLLATAAMIAAVPFAAVAQDYTAEPTYETVSLDNGFSPDPYTIYLSAGGSIAAESISEECAGFIANAPDVRLNYQAGSLPLYISAVSDADTTLVVNGPDNQWYCDDDGLAGLNPLVWFDAPQSGQYDIWVGTYADASLQEATLHFSEVRGGNGEEIYEVDYLDTAESSGAIDFGAEPTYETVSLTAGFTNDPYTVSLSSGGDNDASTLGTPCTGFIASAPDVRLNYEAGSYPLYIRSVSDEDTTLAVNGPDGQWYCDDDGAGNLNAQVWFDAPTSGQYDIFVGSYGGSELHPATLEISEIAQAE